MSGGVVTYRSCRLEVIEVQGGYQVEIQPHCGIPVKPSRTMTFGERAAAVSDARAFVDDSLK